jgi:hypothetical protein
MRNEIFSHIEPDVINCDMFFNGVLGEATLPFIQEMEKFIVTKNVDIKSYNNILMIAMLIWRKCLLVWTIKRNYIYLRK